MVTLKVRIGSYYKKMDFYVANIGHELILGVPWIKSIHITDLLWLERRLGFNDLETGKRHTIFGQGAPPPESLKFKKIMTIRYHELKRHHRNAKWIHEIIINEILLGVKGTTDQETNDPPLHYPPELTALLTQYASRFEQPEGLPPERPEDMEIKLTPGATIPRWRSIGQLSAAELEVLRVQLQDMLNRGHIEHSTSPYGASILFVKKGGWNAPYVY
jgi:hypothetical protein